VPVVATEKVADCPAVTVWLAGCVVIEGAANLPLALLTIPAHPERKKLGSSATATVRRNPTLLVPNKYLEVLIWPRQPNKLRAELQHAPLATGIQEQVAQYI